jgi:hypothetical protein
MHGYLRLASREGGSLLSDKESEGEMGSKETLEMNVKWKKTVGGKESHLI